MRLKKNAKPKNDSAARIKRLESAINQGCNHRLAVTMASNSPGDTPEMPSVMDRPSNVSMSTKEPTPSPRKDKEYGLYFKDRPMQSVTEGGSYSIDRTEQSAGSRKKR
jgi:hypothetical protein